MEETGDSDRVSRRRRVSAVLILALAVIGYIVSKGWPVHSPTVQTTTQQVSGQAADALAKLPIKGRAPKTGYARTNFSNGWAKVGACDLREAILRRDLINIQLEPDNCNVESATLNDPYTGHVINFHRGKQTSAAVEIDHVVAISDAWQTGAQQISSTQRYQLYNDPLELLAVDGPTNVKKGDGDAATWLPPNKVFRCRYVARQIAVKLKYGLWVTAAEHDAMKSVLSSCPGQQLPIAQ